MPVTSGDRTLRAAIDEALRDWVADPTDTYYLLGSAVGPHPYPYLVRELQAVIGREARAQMLERDRRAAGCAHRLRRRRLELHRRLSRLRAAMRRCEIIGVEAGGRGAQLGENAATLAYGRPGVLHGTYSMLLQDADGQIQETHSVSAGLDYPSVGPEHALLAAIGRVRYSTASDAEALAAVRVLSECEGILPALESAHALAGAERWARAAPGRARSSSVSPDAATRTCRRCSRRCWQDGAPMTPRERISHSIRAAAASGEPALVAYLTAGFPAREKFREHLRAHRRGARTWSRSACRSPIRWPTASPSSARASPRWRRA